MIRGYTNIEQGKTLTEILPIESADMWYDNNGESIAGRPEIRCCSFVGLASRNVPCWSLAALLDVLPDEITDDGDVYRNMFFHLKGKYIIQYPRLTTLWPNLLSVEADNPIDASVNMILELKEQNLI